MNRISRFKDGAEERPFRTAPKTDCASIKTEVLRPCRPTLRNSHRSPRATPWASSPPEWASNCRLADRTVRKSHVDDPMSYGIPFRGRSASSSGCSLDRDNRTRCPGVAATRPNSRATDKQDVYPRSATPHRGDAIGLRSSRRGWRQPSLVLVCTRGTRRHTTHTRMWYAHDCVAGRHHTLWTPPLLPRPPQ